MPPPPTNIHQTIQPSSLRPGDSPGPTDLITTLPAELLLRIDDMIDSKQDLNSLAQCNRRLYTALNPRLYQRDAQDKCAALQWAAENAEISTAKLSLAAGADINNVLPRQKFPLYVAVVSRCLIEKSRPWRPEPTRELREKHDDFIKFLLSQGADINFVNTWLDSALLYASEDARYLTIFRMLLENGADPNTVEKCFRGTVVHKLVWGLWRASPDQSDEILEMLRLSLEHGGDPNARDKWKRTPLHYAVDMRMIANQGGCAILERTQLLLQYGADINAQCGRRHTPLQEVITRKPPINEELVMLFLENGADTSLVRLPRELEPKTTVLKLCDEVSRRTGREFDFLPPFEDED